MGLHVVILAAGKGKRMVSNLPKVMHKLGGRAMIEHAVHTAEQLNPDGVHVVYGNGGSVVREQLPHLPVNWVKQEEQLGTGHAVMQAMPNCSQEDQVLVLYADVPLIPVQTLHELLQETPRHGLGLVVTELEDPSGFGRIIRNEVGYITAIVEDKDADEKQKQITEINTGILTASAKHLKSWLPDLKNTNKQHEYYLTDIVALSVASGIPVGGVKAHRPEEVLGVNDRWQLAKLERYYQRSLAKQLAYAGVTIIDPDRLDIRGKVEIEQDVVLDVNVLIEGEVKIGANTYIGPNVILRDVVISDHVEIKANSIIEGSSVGKGCVIGPFARIRPQTVIDEDAKIGNFVEVKKSHIGAGSKASHLTYLGDTTLGKGVNIGAGTITCNYDGVHKYETHIEDGAFIGSNTSLIAPIKVGDHAYIAGGSTVNKDVPAKKLTIARAKQTTINNWKPPE